MRSFFIFLFFTILLTANAFAIGFSPSSLTFSLPKGQEECKIITISSDSESITVTDVWAENPDMEWKVSLFDTPSSTHSVSISYPSTLSSDDREAEICFSGSKAGEYHGAVIFQQEQEGNSIIQFAVWIKAIISATNSESPSSSSRSGGSGGSSGSSIVKAEKISEEKIPEKTEIQPLKTSPETNNDQQPPVQNEPKSKSPIPVFIILIIALIVIITITRRNE
jgi:hypothetical protein